MDTFCYYVIANANNSFLYIFYQIAQLYQVSYLDTAS